ncbi:hypothetical protein GCM10014719_68810 [Planomonospora parontospora subsp. antibiotica]|nr:hypothetical protein GCM10014719_68810 [Planomonospora parontospora subsp. antibiotica]
MKPSTETRQTAAAARRRNVGDIGDADDAGDAAATNSPLLQPAGSADGFGLEEALPLMWFTPDAVVPRLPGEAPGIRHICC